MSWEDKRLDFDLGIDEKLLKLTELRKNVQNDEILLKCIDEEKLWNRFNISLVIYLKKIVWLMSTSTFFYIYKKLRSSVGRSDGSYFYEYLRQQALWRFWQSFK